MVFLVHQGRASQSNLLLIIFPSSALISELSPKWDKKKSESPRRPFISIHSLVLPQFFYLKNLEKLGSLISIILKIPLSESNEQLDFKTTKYFEYSL